MKINAKARLAIEVAPETTTAVGVSFADGTKTLTVPDDLKIEFDVERQLLASSQEATFRVFNLSDASRALVQKDPYVLNEYRAIQFRAGYNNALPLVFNGFVRHATSCREGRDMVTTISAYDGGMAMANGFTSLSLAAGFSARDVIVQLARSLPRIAGSPIVGDFPTTAKRGRALLGNTWQLLLNESGGFATIDNGQVKVLGLDEVVSAPVPVIDSDSGLLGTPRRTPTSLEIEILFQPDLTIGQLVELRSRVQPLYSGVYKVAGFSHRGTISPTEGGTRRTTLRLFYGVDEFQRVQGTLVQ